jgi:hypothetical protein
MDMKIEVAVDRFIVWLWSQHRRAWGWPLTCATLVEALQIAEKMSR